MLLSYFENCKNYQKTFLIRYLLYIHERNNKKSIACRKLQTSFFVLCTQLSIKFSYLKIFKINSHLIAKAFHFLT